MSCEVQLKIARVGGIYENYMLESMDSVQLQYWSWNIKGIKGT